MAASIVDHFAPHRNEWASNASNTDHRGHRHLESGPQMSSHSLPIYHQRNNSETHAGSGSGSEKPSLPPFSNFLAGAGRPDLTYRPTVQSEQVPLSLRHGERPLPTTPGVQSNPYSFDEHSRRTSTSVSPTFTDQSRTDQSLTSGEYQRRFSNALPSLPEPSAAKIGRPYASPGSCLDTTSPGGRANPKLLREEVVAGKGVCYIYDDGSVCPKVVNGDTVNPQWGTTKAGKPRKRLGQACNTCREKKIKCDPSYPKCSQCQKFGRECRFEATSRSSYRSPTRPTTATSPAPSQISDDSSSVRRPSFPPFDNATSGEVNHTSTMNVGALLSPPATSQVEFSDFTTSSKRMRITDSSQENQSHAAVRLHGAESATRPDSCLGYSWRACPLDANPQLTNYYINGFFTHANTATMELFPHNQFMTWLNTEQNKSTEDRMVMYAMLSLATIFAPNPDRARHRDLFIATAHKLLEHDLATSPVQTMQTLILLSLAEFSRGNETLAFALGGRATRLACGMRYNTEEGVSKRETCTYGMSSEMFIECKRRSFWAAYIIDLFGACTLGYSSSINKADIFIRLPCAPHLYQQGAPSAAPCFEGDAGVSQWLTNQDQSQVGTFAYLAQIATICYDIQATAIRARNQIATTYSVSKNLRLTLQRLQFEEQLKTWGQGYQAQSSVSARPGNSKRSASTSKFAGLHILFHWAHMELNRHIYHEKCSQQEITEHVKKAHLHAWKTLEIAKQLVSRGYTDIRDFSFAVESPLTGIAIFTAIDIVTAVGLKSDLLENRSRYMQMVYGGIELLDRLAELWDIARQQRELVSERMQMVLAKINESVADHKTAYFVTEPMGMSLGRDFDLIYGIDRMQYLSALDWGDSIDGEEDLMEISMDGRRASSARS